MDNRQLELLLLKAIRENLQKDGWAPLSAIDKVLIDAGVNYKEYKCNDAFSLVRKHAYCIIWDKDDPKNIFIKEKTERGKDKYQKIRQERTGESKITASNALAVWASMGDFKETIDKLKSIALPERWDYKEINHIFPSPILAKYLKYTFYKLQQEKGKIIERDKYAAFNTGLVDKRYKPVYALFYKPHRGVKQWVFESFCIAGEEREGKKLVEYFNPLPARAHYADNVADMLYDTKASKPELDLHHIVVENIDRLPLAFLEDNCPSGFEIKNVKSLNNSEKEAYYKNLSQAIENDAKTYRSITNRFNDALELSLKRVDWNFKTAIPVYFPTRNSMSLLLPLALMDDEKVDIALVVEKTISGNYLGHTILPLDWAYSNARLICRPDSDWLTADNISSEHLEEDIKEV